MFVGFGNPNYCFYKKNCMYLWYCFKEKLQLDTYSCKAIKEKSTFSKVYDYYPKVIKRSKPLGSLWLQTTNQCQIFICENIGRNFKITSFIRNYCRENRFKGRPQRADDIIEEFAIFFSDGGAIAKKKQHKNPFKINWVFLRLHRPLQ